MGAGMIDMINNSRRKDNWTERHYRLCLTQVPVSVVSAAGGGAGAGRGRGGDHDYRHIDFRWHLSTSQL